MSDTLCRISITAGGFAVSQPTMISSGNAATGSIPCKEWSITDDILNMSDTACVTVSNVNGENANVFSPGQRVEIDLRDDEVASGAWVRSFTGVIIRVVYGSDTSGGSVIQLSMMDVGWYLSSCAAKPLTNIKYIQFSALLQKLLDPSWGISSIVASNDLNRRLKHGRQVIVQNLKPVLGAILPYIQVEPGQMPADILTLYAARDGVLVNASADGSLVFFRPDSNQQALYSAVYEPGSALNNLVGRPTRDESIDGLYSSVECWSTVVIDPAISGLANPENPNAAFRHTTYTPPTSPLPFGRRCVMTDAEAINSQLRMNRAIWKYQMGLFQSFTYSCEFDRHSQNGAFFVSDTMITVDDTVNGVKGVYYVQSVQRSQTLSGGSSTKLTIRRPGLLNPDLNSLNVGGGAKGPAKVKSPGLAKLPARLAALLGRKRTGGDQ